MATTGYNTTTLEVSANAVDREPVAYVNFGVHKKNVRGRYQYRKLQFDFKSQSLWNIKGETEKEIKGFKFIDVRAVEREPDNPLSFHIFFRDNTPYHIYAQSRRDADLMMQTLENIISNNKVKLDTTCNYSVAQIKAGAAMLKQGVGWQKRWLELYKWPSYPARTKQYRQRRKKRMYVSAKIILAEREYRVGGGKKDAYIRNLVSAVYLAGPLRIDRELLHTERTVFVESECESKDLASSFHQIAKAI